MKLELLENMGYHSSKILYIPDDDFAYSHINYGPANLINRYSKNSAFTLGKHFAQKLFDFDIDFAQKKANEFASFIHCYDSILIHSQSLPWIRVFRDMGVRCPFLIYMDYVNLDIKMLFGLYIASTASQWNDILICNSQAASNNFNSTGFETSNLNPFGFNFDFFSNVEEKNRTDLRKKLGLRQDKKYLVIANRLFPESKTYEFIKAMHFLFNKESKYHLLIIDENNHPLYKSKLLESFQNFNISVFQSLNKEQFRDIYAASDLHVVPANCSSDTGCKTVFESMACNTPGLVPQNGVYTEQLSPEFTTFYECNQEGIVAKPDLLMKEIEKLFCKPKNPSFLEKMHEFVQQYSHQNALERFSSLICPDNRKYHNKRENLLTSVFEHYQGMTTNELFEIYKSNKIAYNKKYYSIWSNAGSKNHISEKLPQLLNA